MSPDLHLMRSAVEEAVQALQPILLSHGAERGLPAIAAALGMLVVASHRTGMAPGMVADTTASLVRCMGNAVGGALEGLMARDGTRGGNA